VEILRKLYPEEAYAEINPEDARSLNLKEGERVKVVSRRGEALVSAAITESSPAGQVFLPMHYIETNRLTFPAFDPHSREPAYKLAAVRLEKA
jgi:ferredoxin-nitrate reductase